MKISSAVAFATSIAVRSTGASRNASKPPCSRSATNNRLTASIAANSSVTVKHAGRELARECVPVQGEVEDHERHDR